MSQRLFVFSGGTLGAFQVTSQSVLCGEPLPSVARLDVCNAEPGDPAPAESTFVLRGIVSNERYVTRPEREALVKVQAAIGRPEARCGAFIPIKKKAEWWVLTQDERRSILEERSRHIAIGLDYLPAIARRLHHCRDLGTPEPFDFLTWFDFAEQDSTRFDDLLHELRETPEWQYVEREVEIRVVRV